MGALINLIWNDPTQLCWVSCFCCYYCYCLL